MVNHGDVVDKAVEMQRLVAGSGVELRLHDGRLDIEAPSKRGATSLRLVRLLHPSSQQVKDAAAPDAVLVLVSPSVKAAQAALPFNHIVLPEGGFRLIAPGVALVREALPPVPGVHRQTRLRGQTGTVAETLLLGGARAWTVEELASASGVSKSLAHRVLQRLQDAQVLTARGEGPRKKRELPGQNLAALAELWAQEEAPSSLVLRGYIYGSSPEAVAGRALQLCPGGALGGVGAANFYAPTLTRVPFPVRVWVPQAFRLGRLREAGLEETGEGANIEILQSKGDPWRRHRSEDALPKVSAWRAWMEISQATGRTGELAHALWGRLFS